MERDAGQKEHHKPSPEAENPLNYVCTTEFVRLDCKAQSQSKESLASHTQMEQSESHIALCVHATMNHFIQQYKMSSYYVPDTMPSPEDSRSSSYLELKFS